MSHHQIGRPGRTPSLFEKLNKLTSANYPNIHESSSARLFNLKNSPPPQRTPQNIYKINYTIIQNDFPQPRQKGLSKYNKFPAIPNPFPHKASLYSPPPRKTTEKKRSFSENGRGSLSNIVENQKSALANNKINYFEKPKSHALYFEEKTLVPERISLEKQGFGSFVGSSPNLTLAVPEFYTCKEPAKNIVVETEKKMKTNSLGNRKVNFAPKTASNFSSKAILPQVDVSNKMTKKPNISLDIHDLQDEYDFGVKKMKNQEYRQSIFIDNETESLKKMDLPNKKRSEESDRSNKSKPMTILVINEADEKVSNIDVKNENEVGSLKMEEEFSSSSDMSHVSCLKPEDSERVSIMKINRKNNKMATKVKFNDYQYQKEPAKGSETNSKCLTLISICKAAFEKITMTLSFRRIYEKIIEIINQGLIEVLITSSNNREIALSYRKTKKIVLPGSTLRKFWDAFIMILIFYQLIRVPLIIAFKMDEDIQTFAVSETFISIGFLIDIFLNFRTGYINSRGILELYPAKISKRYWRKYFIFDFISAIPIYSFGSSQWVYLLRLLRISRLLRIISRFTEYINYHPAILRIIKAFILLLYLWHWIACFYWYICITEGVSAAPWGNKPDLFVQSFLTQYLNSLFFAVTVTTGVGANLNPATDLETVYTIFSIVIGVFMYGLILGAASGGLSSLDEGDSELRKQMEALNQFLRKKKLSVDLQKRIQENLKYVWSSHQSFNVNSHWFLKGVHQLLQLELTIEINKKYLEKVPMFKHISFDCMIFLISILENRIYLPEEFVVYEKTEGKEMFFIQSGLLEVIDPSKSLRIRLIEGDFFGEQALLNNMKRNASVKSVVYSELLILTRDGLKKVIYMYPDFALKLFSYLKKKIWNQLRSRGDISAKFKWSFLVLMVKTAINICKLSDHALKMEAFLAKSFISYTQNSANPNNNNLIKLTPLKNPSRSDLSPAKKSNIYSGIRELSEFVMTKTKQQTFEENNKEGPLSTKNRGDITPQEALKFRFTKYTKKNESGLQKNLKSMLSVGSKNKYEENQEIIPENEEKQ